MNTEVKKIKLGIDFSKEKKTGSKIESAINAVGNVNMKPCGESHSFKGLLKRHGGKKFRIELD